MHPQDRLFCEIAVQLSVLTREQVARCMRAQQYEEAGKNIATVAVALGFTTHAAVANVQEHQQRLLERRREARHASRVQQDGMSRMSPGVPPSTTSSTARPSAIEHPSEPQRPAVRPREATPTSRWVYSEPPARGRSRSEDLRPSGANTLPPPPDDDDDEPNIRETLDVRPPGRPGGRLSPRPAALTRPHLMAGPATLPIEAHELMEPIARSLPPSAAKPPLPPPRYDLPPLGRSNPNTLPVAPGRRSGDASPRPFAKPAANEPRSPLFNGAATSSPVPPPAPPAPLLGARGTLLEPSGRRQLREDQARLDAAAMVTARPVPSGRDWRNPSRPPPPSVGLEFQGFDSEPAAAREARALPSLHPDTLRYIDEALALCAEHAGSDLLLHSGASPFMRVDGELLPFRSAALSPAVLERILGEILDDSQFLQLSVDGELCARYEAPNGQVCARLHAYASELGLNAVLRALPKQVPTPEELGLALAELSLSQDASGLHIYSGPAGSGKTTTLWSLAQRLVAERALHVVSLESTLELHIDGAAGVFEQREVGKHVASYAEGIDWAVSQAADVILVADLLAPGALLACLRAANSGMLVLAAVRAPSSHRALASLLERAGQDGERARGELARALRVLFHQRLVPKARGTGRVAAIEQLRNAGPLCQLLRDDQVSQLPHLLATGRSEGMLSLEDALDELVRDRRITLAAACATARNSARFQGG